MMTKEEKDKRGIRIIHKADRVIDAVLLVFFAICFLYGVYTIWDNHQIYDGASTTLYSKYNPTQNEILSTYSFKQFQKINSEAFGWIEVYGTGINYPLLQSSTTDDQKYIKTNAIGNYSLSGSIYLDSRNKKDMSDFVSIIYGHHMEKHEMFGDLQEFDSRSFFKSHKYGNLYYGGRNYGLQIFAYIDADASDYSIYSPGNPKSYKKYVANLYNKAKYTRKISIGKNDHIALLSTCASYKSNSRQLVAAKITDKTYKNIFGSSKLPWWKGLLNWFKAMPTWLGVTLVSFIILLLLALYVYIERRYRKGHNKANN